MDINELKSRLRLPVVAAPMFLVSGVELLVACCKAGIVGSYPTANSRSVEELTGVLRHIHYELEDATQLSGEEAAPWALNLIERSDAKDRYQEEIRLVQRFRPPIVITSFGQPGPVVSVVHDYGGLVFHDVATLRHAEKAIEARVDGLILLTAGAGGHTGEANPFAFVPQIRRHWSGAILLAGAVSDGQSIAAAEVLGADFAYMGTRFAATTESEACDEYKRLLVTEDLIDVVTTDRLSGVKATFLRSSIARVGLDPENLPPLKVWRMPDLPSYTRPWRDIWSAGHGVANIDEIISTRQLVAKLVMEYGQTSERLPKLASASSLDHEVS